MKRNRSADQLERDLDQRRSRFDADRRGRGRHRQNDGAGQSHRPGHRDWPCQYHRNRQRDLYRKSRGRVEASPPRSSEEARNARKPRRDFSRADDVKAWTPPSASSKKLKSARFTASAPICFASGPSKRASILCSRCSPKRSRAGCTTPPSTHGSRNSSPIHPKAFSVRFAARCFPDSALSRTRRKGLSIGCGMPAGS